MLKEGRHVTLFFATINNLEKSATSYLSIATAFACLDLAFGFGRLKRARLFLEIVP